jgi:hypothetical protein
METETAGAQVPRPEIRAPRIPELAVLKCILLAMLISTAWLGYDLAKTRIELQYSTATAATWQRTCEDIRDYEFSKRTR